MGRWNVRLLQASFTPRPNGSSRQAADFGAQAVIAGAYDIIVGSGVESMSRVPMFTSRMGADTYGPSAAERYAPGLVPQGVSAELIAARWKLDGETPDQFSARSHARASAADFSREIVPNTLPDGSIVTKDETVRPGTAVERLG